MDKFEIRRAQLDERDALLEVCNTAFGTAERKRDFESEVPVPWVPKRIADHWVACDDGQIVAVIGAYPVILRMCDVDFRTVGVGQVSTLPSHRGMGIMSALLKAATQEMDGRCDFSWLWGDRHRYGRYGWAKGGITQHFDTTGKYLPSPPADEEVTTLTPQQAVGRICKWWKEMPFGADLTEQEVRLQLSRPGARTVALGEAWATFTEGQGSLSVFGGDGDLNELAALLAHLVHKREETEKGWSIEFVTPPCDCALQQVAVRHYWRMDCRPTASFRICDMGGYFERAARIMEPTLQDGNGELELRNVDNGQEVRIVCRNGSYDILPEAGATARKMTTTEISEAVFGLLPLDVVLPGLPAASPIRALFNAPMHINPLCAL